MPIVSSTYTVDAHTQVDGSRTTVARCTDSLGKEHQFVFKLQPGQVVDDVIAAQIVGIEKTLAQIEFDSKWDSDAALALIEQTTSQFASRFFAKIRQAKRDGDRTELAKLAWRLYKRIQAGYLTSDEVRLAYNAEFDQALNPAQWNTYVTTKLVPLKDAYQAMIDADDL